MKNYTKPELLICKFDTEDIITASGVMGTGADAIGAYGNLFTDAENQNESTAVTNAENTAVVYFNWK